MLATAAKPTGAAAATSPPFTVRTCTPLLVVSTKSTGSTSRSVVGPTGTAWAKSPPGPVTRVMVWPVLVSSVTGKLANPGSPAS